ncbi:hypothetical protein K0M31_008010 [Melipona bicolor]|uniref:Uncharacterized protein n=1 Tax=Melipona bicolor TaxID=60889 RepID=A0AA40KWC4_9HYME|nr:hypothetical protein K0M31_008010 [Melipona bicolor]
MEPDVNVEEPTVREQHFYREGNAEVLRLVTRGQLEDTSHLHRQASHHHRPTALIVDGKDIILQRFIEDQKSRHELSMQDIEAARSMESHQRSKEVCQQQQPPEIILIPERLDHHGRHRQHQLSSLEEIGPTVQRLVIDHGDYGSQKTTERESQMREKQESVNVPIADKPPIPDVPVKEQRVQVPPDDARYSFHDLELARQNALLTRLLLERESRRAGGGGMDSTSYLETQSLPGQVAIATQTDRTAATQTEHQAKSRSDNDESDNEESRHRRRLKSRKRYGEGDWRRCRAPWTKSSPIEKEARRSPCFDKRLSILRKKVREVKEGRKISLEPGVLREISDSLDGNGSSCKGEEDERTRRSYQRTEQTSISYKILNEKKSDSQSSEEKRRKSCEDDRKANATGDRSASSSEVKVQRERREKSPRKEARSKKTQRRSDGGATKPSFRILEKEFTMLTKKLSKLGERRKFQESFTGSTDEKSERSFAKKTDSSSSQKQTAMKAEQGKGKQGKDSAIAKTKQKLKYQQSHQVMSTGSSELDDGLDKPKKSIAKQQRQPIGIQSHAKVKRQAQIDRRESKRQSTLPEYRDEEVDTPKPEPKPDKLGRLTRAPKLAVVSRKQNVSEETSTSATEEKKDGGGTFSTRDLASKKSSTDLSEGDSNASNRRGDSTTRRREAETLPRKIIPQRFSDDFVEEPKAEVSAVTEERETKSDATGQVSDNEPGTLDSFDKLAKRLSKDASTKGTIDDQLITGSTKKETRTARDRWMDKASWGTESTESIRHADMVMKKEEIAQTDKSMSETERDVARRVQRDYKAKDESLDEEFEITAVDGRLKEKKQEEEKMRKLSKDLARQSVALEGLDETETPAGEKSAYISSDYVDRDKGIMLDVEDKVDVKEESKRGPEVKDHMRKEEERTKKIEEPSEEYVETEISSDGTTEVCRKKEVEVDETDREEEKQTRHAKDVSTLDYVATEEKKIEFNVRDKGKIDLDAIKVPCEHEKETHDGKVEGDVLLDEWEKYEDKDAEKMKSTFGDRDKSIGDEKKEVVARDTAEDSEETTVETTGDQKFEEETLEKIATDSTKDRRVTEDSKTSEDEKTDEKVTEESRISKQATTDKKISEETTKETRNGDKVAGELPAEREIVETAKEEEQQSVREKEGYQIAERTSSEDDAAAGHLGIVAKAIDFVEREKIFDEEKKIWTETDTERETVFLDKVKRSDTADVRSDDRETSLDGEGFSEESQKKRSSPEGEGICMKKEGQIVTGDLEVSKGDVSTGKEEEMVILEKEDASREKEEKEASAIDDKEEKITEKASDHRIGEKETSKGARETDEDRVSDEKIANIEQQPLTEKKDDASTIRRDKTEKDDSLKVSTSHREKQDGEETKVLIETPASISDDVKEEAPMEAETPAPDDHHSKRDSVFLEAFETVHSLVDTLTNGKTPSPKTEAAASEQSLPDKKELSSYREGEKPSTSRVNGDSATSLDQEKVKEDAGGGKSIDSTDSNKLTTGSTKEKSDEKGPVLTDEREISESLKDDETKDTDVEKLREEKPAEEVVEDNETADEKLAGTTEKEEDRSPGEASGGGTRPQTYATEEKEKFAPDSIISEVTTDSDVPPESGKQLKLESEQTELQEVEQFVGGETFAAAEATFPEKWPSMTVSDVPGTTGWESDNKHDLIVLRMDKTSLAKEDEEERPGVFLEGQSTDVSLPLFTSAIDTADDSEDSDSSSDVSRKTTLTTRPYQTPRHRARRLSEKENNQVEEPIEARSIEDEGKEATVSIGETEDEDSFWIIEGTNVERSSPTKSSEEDKETEELASREKDTEEDEETAVTNTEKEEQFECDPATDKGSSTAGKDEPLKDSRVKPGIKADRQDGSSALASKLAQTETFKVIDKRAKELGRKRVVPQRKKKSSSEESSEEKAAGHRTRRKLSEDQPRQKEQSVEQTKQSGKRDERKQSLSRLKAEREKKSSSSSEKYPTPPKTGEIDTSKAQPKYMAWYKKNREEMERKRAELLATDDEEQLPRWLRRSMRNQKSEKDDRKVEKPSQKKTVDTTPRTRRKVKPLVNVESEQLKAIVRQGRKLRRAEGGKNEDPPVQIFATTPPAVPQDPKHHLLQHSEYKYEKMPVPFYLHPPPAPHPSPQLSPEHFEIPPTVEHRTSEDFDSGIAVSLQQGGNRLRHQQLLEKKSVFDIAYSEAAPSQLRSDSTSPPS